MATIGHGSTRATYDVDICSATDSASLEEIEAIRRLRRRLGTE